MHKITLKIKSFEDLESVMMFIKNRNIEISN